MSAAEWVLMIATLPVPLPLWWIVLIFAGIAAVVAITRVTKR
jgi:hypothetical protein